MSLPLVTHCVSNPRQQLALITIIVVIVLASPTWTQIVGAYADGAAFLALCLTLGSTARRRAMDDPSRVGTLQPRPR